MQMTYPRWRTPFEASEDIDEDLDNDVDLSLGFLAGLSVPREVRFLFDDSLFGFSSFSFADFSSFSLSSTAEFVFKMPVSQPLTYLTPSSLKQFQYLILGTQPKELLQLQTYRILIFLFLAKNDQWSKTFRLDHVEDWNKNYNWSRLFYFEISVLKTF